MLLAVRIVLAIIYFLAGLALFWGRKRLAEEGEPPNLVIPAVLLILAGITTLIR